MAVLRTLRAQCESEAKVLAFVFSVIALDCAVVTWSLLST